MLLVIVAALVMGAPLVTGRPLALGTRLCLEAWVSLAVQVPVEAALSHTVGSEAPGGPGRLPRLLSRSLAAFGQVELLLHLDWGAVPAPSVRQAARRLPVAVRGLPDGLSLQVLEVSRDGQAVLLVAGQHRELSAGEGADWALVPAAAGGWELVGDDWRAVITERLAAGQAVGRLSLVNLGLARSGTWP